jgi:demethylmenaquinone methyltransferase / 2-methoxy-6-polyprenyl-1,4-benzoquinol methylase
LGEPLGKTRFVRALFDSIAFRYDLVNRVITLGQIGRWRERVAREVGRHEPRLALDVGTGTGDLALALARRTGRGSHVLGFDLSPEMLRQAQAKAKRQGLQGRISFVLADATALPLRDGVADCLVNAFFLRHLSSLPASFVELRRVLRAGGRVGFLELTQPARSPLRPLFRLWFNRVVPLVGGWMSGNRQAYDYLPDSLRPFPNAIELAGLLREAGFESVEWRLLGMGTVALHSGVRSTRPDSG